MSRGGTVLLTFMINIIFVINTEANSEGRDLELKHLNNVVLQLRAVVHYYEHKRELRHGNESNTQRIRKNERNASYQKYLDELSEEEGRFYISKYKDHVNNFTSLKREGDWKVNRSKEEKLSAQRDSIIKDTPSVTSPEIKMLSEAVRSQKLLSMWYQDELENEGEGKVKSVDNDHYATGANEHFSADEYFNEHLGRKKNEAKSNIIADIEYDRVYLENETLRNSDDIDGYRSVNKTIGSVNTDVKEKQEKKDNATLNEQSNHFALKDLEKGKETNRSTVNKQGNVISIIKDFSKEPETNISILPEHVNHILLIDMVNDQETNRSIVNEHGNHISLKDFSKEQETNTSTWHEHSNHIPLIKDSLKEQETNRSTWHIPLIKDSLKEQETNRSTWHEHSNHIPLIKDSLKEQEINRSTVDEHIPLTNLANETTDNSTLNERDIHIHIRIPNHGTHIPLKHLSEEQVINRFTLNEHGNHIPLKNDFIKDQETNRSTVHDDIPLNDLANEKTNKSTLNERDIHILNHIRDLAKWYRPQSVRAEQKLFYNLTEGSVVDKVISSLRKESARRVEEDGKKYLSSLHNEEARLNELLGMMSPTDRLTSSKQNHLLNNFTSNSVHYNMLRSSLTKSNKTTDVDNAHSKEEHGGSATTENKEVKRLLDAINAYPGETNSADKSSTGKLANHLPLHINEDIQNKNNATNDNIKANSRENEPNNMNLDNIMKTLRKAEELTNTDALRDPYSTIVSST